MNTDPRMSDRAKGFTLIELMVTLAIMVILMVIAAPSFSTFQRNSELRSAANAFLASLSTARAEAMQRGLRTFVVPLSDNDWRRGWRVFVDTNWNGIYDTGTDIEVNVHEALPAPISLVTDTGVNNFAQSGSYYAAFAPSGFPTLTGAGTAGGAIQFRVSGTNESRRVVLNAVGRVRVCTPGNTDCDPSSF